MGESKSTSLVYRGIYFLFELFPAQGPRLVDRLVFLFAGNKLVYHAVLKTIRLRLKKIGKPEKLCVLADVNIGDAVMVQSAVAALREIFPDARIDYVVKKYAKSLVADNPHASRVLPVYTGAPVPTAEDIAAVNEILAKNDYDIVFNLSPFLKRKKIIVPPRTKIIGYFGLVASVVRAEGVAGATSHIVYQAHDFFRNLFAEFSPAGPEKGKVNGVELVLPDEAFAEAKNFLKKNKRGGRRGKVFFNPDSSAALTLIPPEIQARLLEKIVDLGCDVLLGAGYSQKDLGTAIREELPAAKRSRVTIIPADMPIDVYAALIDCCDVCLTGDTGFLHIASARKTSQSGKPLFRNKTAVFSVFGVTPVRMYGYDSEKAGFLPANQDAPSRVYVAPGNRSNLAYVAKGKIYYRKGDSFFRDLDVDKIVKDVEAVLWYNGKEHED